MHIQNAKLANLLGEVLRTIYMLQ